MPELTAILVAKRESEYQERKFFAAIQGVDLDAQSGSSVQKKWEDLKAKAFSHGSVTDSNDIVSLQGKNARQKGFGIGSGLEYSKGESIKNPFG
jgi:hypothetical protein